MASHKAQAIAAVSGMAPALPAEYTRLVEELREQQAALGRLIASQQALETQLVENEGVKEELAADPGAVYKLSGRVLVKQDLGEARSTVARRLDFIKAEMCVAGLVGGGSGMWVGGWMRGGAEAQREIARSWRSRVWPRASSVWLSPLRRAPTHTALLPPTPRRKLDKSIKEAEDRLGALRAQLQEQQLRASAGSPAGAAAAAAARGVVTA